MGHITSCDVAKLNWVVQLLAGLFNHGEALSKGHNFDATPKMEGDGARILIPVLMLSPFFPFPCLPFYSYAHICLHPFFIGAEEHD